MDTWIESFGAISTPIDFIGMMHYRTPWEGILDGIVSGRLLERNLMLLFLASVAAFVILFRRALPLKPPFLSHVLFVSLCPFIACALIAYIRLQRLIESDSGVAFPDQLREVTRPFTLGIASSFVLVCVYSVAYLSRREVSKPTFDAAENAASAGS